MPGLDSGRSYGYKPYRAALEDDDAEVDKEGTTRLVAGDTYRARGLLIAA